MESERLTKRARRAEVGEGEASSSQQAEVGHASELSALEQLPPDVLAEVLQLLGPVESAPLRLVSSSLRGAVDNVRWRWLKFLPRSLQHLELAAQLFEPEKPSAAGGQHARKIRLAPAAEVVVSVDRSWTDCLMYRLDVLKTAVVSLLSGCTRSSGGLGSVALRGFFLARYPCPSNLQFVEACLDAICAGAEDCSCSTLKTLELEVFECLMSPLMDKSVVRRLAHFTRLESLTVARLGFIEAADAANLAGSLPALRKVGLKVHEGAALAAFGEHRALVELDISRGIFFEPEHCFEHFSVSPVARRLRSLNVRFGEDSFGIAELPLLGRLVSLESLQLGVKSDVVARLGPDAYVQALASLEKLRALSLDLWPEKGSLASPANLRGVARAIAALRAKTTVDLTLWVTGADEGGEDTGLDAAVAELLRAAGPALVELRVVRGEAVLRGEAARALAACPRLRKLGLDGRRWGGIPLPVAVGVLAACPSLESLSGLTIAFNGERVATEGLEGPLQRLAAACKLGAGSGCSFVLLPSDAISDADRDRVRRLAVECVQSIFPKASVELS